MSKLSRLPYSNDVMWKTCVIWAIIIGGLLLIASLVNATTTFDGVNGNGATTTDDGFDDKSGYELELSKLYRTAELLRLEHNEYGRQFKEGQMKESSFREYQKYDFELRLKTVLHKINLIKERESLNVEGIKQENLDVLKEDAKKDDRLDAEIDIKSIEKSGKVFIPGSPYEVFTAYTEVDPNARIATSTYRATITALTNNEDAYLYDNKGIDYFDADFEHLISCYVDAIDETGFGIFWSMTTEVDDLAGLETSNLSFFYTFFYGRVAGQRVFLREIDGGVEYQDFYTGVSLDTLYYFKVARDEAVGTYGTLYNYIYDDSDRTNLIDTLSIALHTAKRDFRYIFAVNTYNSAFASSWTGYIENLDLQEEEPPTPITDTVRLNMILLWFFGFLIMLGTIKVIMKKKASI